MTAIPEILLPIVDDEELDARVAAALELLNVFNARLVCVDVEACTAGAMARSEARSDADESALRKELDLKFRKAAIDWTWATDKGCGEDTICNAVDRADMVIAGPDPEFAKGAFERPSIASTSLAAAKPLVVIPQKCAHLRAAGVAVVAWDGSAAALAALRTFAPLLAHARTVFIVVVDDGEPHGIAVQDVCAYLHRHGTEATMCNEKTDGRATVSARLLEFADDMEADYFVLGACARPHVAGQVFGGVTRSMLIHSPLPMLIAH